MVLKLCLVHAFGSTLLQKDALLPGLPHMLVLMELKLLGELRTSSRMHQLEGLSLFQSRQTGNETLTDFFTSKQMS